METHPGRHQAPVLVSKLKFKRGHERAETYGGDNLVGII